MTNLRPIRPHLLVLLTTGSLHLPPPTSHFPPQSSLEMSRPRIHTHTYTHAHAHTSCPPMTTETVTSLKIFIQGQSAGVGPSFGFQALQGPKPWRQERADSLGWISPRSEAGKRGSDVPGGGMKKTQSQKDAVHSLVSPALPSSRRVLSPESPLLEGCTATVSSLHPQSGYP